MRILGGTKTGGAGGRKQACYICLLYDHRASGQGKAAKSHLWLYATLPHVTPKYKYASSSLLQKIEEELASFEPASVSGATQQATKYTPPKPQKDEAGNGGKKRKSE